MPFKKAERHAQRLRVALAGPSHSGKTWSALVLAQGMVEKMGNGARIALIDTERGSASLYGDEFDFDTLELTPPYTANKYWAAIKEAEQAGYGVIIIDSLSHAWQGEGGILEQVDNASAGAVNKFAAWGPATKQQNLLINTILQSPCHIITTLRVKQEYALQLNDKGKQVPVKLGLAPVQRDGVEYEFDTVLYLDMEHCAGVGLRGKDRTGLFTGEPAPLTKADGERMIEWLKVSNGEEWDKILNEWSLGLGRCQLGDQVKAAEAFQKMFDERGAVFGPKTPQAVKTKAWEDMLRSGTIFGLIWNKESKKWSAKPKVGPMDPHKLWGEIKEAVGEDIDAVNLLIPEVLMQPENIRDDMFKEIDKSVAEHNYAYDAESKLYKPSAPF